MIVKSTHEDKTSKGIIMIFNLKKVEGKCGCGVCKGIV